MHRRYNGKRAVEAFLKATNTSSVPLRYYEDATSEEDGDGVSEEDCTLGGGLPADTEEDVRTVHRERAGARFHRRQPVLVFRLWGLG